MSYDSKKTEDEWFVRHEKDLLEGVKRDRLRREKEMAELMKQEEAKKRKELHWMKCPKCGSDLKEVDVQDVIIDKCTFCEGIFFDRNELDQLLIKHDRERQSFLGRLVNVFSSKSESTIPSRTNVELTRSKIRLHRQEIVAKALDLSESEATKFWPLYKEYRDQINKLLDEQTEILFEMAKNYKDLSDAKAAELQNQLQTIAKGILEVKEKYTPKFREILPAKKVARYFHIEFKMDSVLTYEIAETIPLIE